jgi:hypothetical protein
MTFMTQGSQPDPSDTSNVRPEPSGDPADAGINRSVDGGIDRA